MIDCAKEILGCVFVVSLLTLDYLVHFKTLRLNFGFRLFPDSRLASLYPTHYPATNFVLLSLETFAKPQSNRLNPRIVK